MKISQDMIDAGAKAYCANRFEHGDKAIVWNDAIEAAIRAALRVRKARKKAKREKAQAEVDENDMIDRAIANGKTLSFEDGTLPVMVPWGKPVKTPDPKPLTIQAGKSYRMRNGEKAVITYANSESSYPIIGVVNGKKRLWESGGRYAPDGRYRTGRDSPLDLIAEWQE